jgi:hypothetical protein
MNRGKVKMFIFMVFALMVLSGGAYLVYSNRDTSNVIEIACTEEAKLCPDGTTVVGRVPPDCKFAPCPGEEKVPKG